MSSELNHFKGFTPEQIREYSRYSILRQLPGVVKTIARCGGAVAIVYFLSGRDTFLYAIIYTNVLKDVNVTLKWTTGVSFIINIILLINNRFQAIHHKQKMKDQSEIIGDLQKQLDPSRTSSGIRETGTTQSEDR